MNRVYAHRLNCGRDICKADTYILVPDKEKIEELKNELSKFGVIIICESVSKPITEIHLAVEIPYKNERLK